MSTAATIARIPGLSGTMDRVEATAASIAPDAPDDATLDIAEDYQRLNREFRERGLYETNHGFYLRKYALILGLLAGAWFLAPTHAIVAGLMLGLFCQQSAFIGHDLGHNSVMSSETGWLFNRKYKNWGAWLVGNVCFGVDGLNWSAAHDGHHRVNLRYDADPQNTHMPWLLYERGELEYYEQRKGPISDFHRGWLRNQHFIMIPLMLLYGKINIMSGERKLLSRGQYLRFGGIAIHFGIWVALVAHAGNPLLFFMVALCMAGVIHIQILLSHAYMPRFSIDEQDRLGWIRYQVIGTQNVDTTWYDGWFHGGLQYQLEHHLYARLPSHNLKKIKPDVEAFCARHDLPYNSDPFRVCIADMLKSFYRETRSV